MIQGGLESIVDYIRNNNVIKWMIKEGDGNNDYIFKSDDGKTVESNIRTMEQVMKDVSSRKLTFIGRDELCKNSASGNYTQFFSTVVDEPKQQQQTQQPQIGVVTVEELERRLTEERKKWDEEQEMQRLKQKLADAEEEVKNLKKPINDVIRRLSPLVEPVVGLILNKFTPAQAMQPTIGTLDSTKPINNTDMAKKQEQETANVAPETIDDSENNETIADDEELLLRLYDEFKKVDADCLQLLTAICKIGISQKPIMNMPYKTIKQMIIAQADKM